MRPPASSGWKLFAPARLLRRLVQDRQRAWVFGQHPASELDGILLDRRSHFIHETFNYEEIVRRTNSTPPARIDAVGLVADIIHENRVLVVGRLRGALDRIRIDTLDEGRGA